MRGLVIGAAAGALAMAMAGWAQLPHRTVQQEFDAATALDDAGDHAGALAAWQALEARTAVNKRSHSLVLVRKSSSLIALGRIDEAAAAAHAGLADLPANDPTLRADRSLAFFDLGRIAAEALDYAGALASFEQAEAAGDTPGLQFPAQLGIIETGTFVDPAAASAAVARAEKLTAATKTMPRSLGVLAEDKAMLLLNRGEIEAARQASVQAVTLMGGLTERTDLHDVSARSTAAVAALLARKDDDARRYMAMTGAGRMEGVDFDPAVQMKVPDCGGEAGLKPADMAVIEFSIGADGAVTASRPIYAAGGGAVALEFARAAKEWSWTPEQVAKLPPFFRNRVRVELRCSTAFERPSIEAMLGDEAGAWLQSRGMAGMPDGSESDAAALPGERMRLAAAEAKSGRDALATLPLLLALTDNALVGREEKHALAQRGLAIARANKAPATTQLLLDLRVHRTEDVNSWRRQEQIAMLTPLLVDPVYAGDPHARAALRLIIADGSGSGDRAKALLGQVQGDSTLAANDPLRVGAAVRFASLEEENGNHAAARAAFEQSGLAANQCAIVDAPPKVQHLGGTFPREALVWGFEGWATTQYDITADGRVQNERAVLSYPPFVFSKAAEQTMAETRYTKTFRPDGSLGCGAQTQRVRFAMPR